MLKKIIISFLIFNLSLFYCWDNIKKYDQAKKNLLYSDELKKNIYDGVYSKKSVSHYLVKKKKIKKIFKELKRINIYKNEPEYIECIHFIRIDKESEKEYCKKYIIRHLLLEEYTAFKYYNQIDFIPNQDNFYIEDLENIYDKQEDLFNRMEKNISDFKKNK